MSPRTEQKDVSYTSYGGHLADWQAEFVTRARSEAAQHRPPTGQTALDSNEAELVAEASRCLRGEHRLLQSRLQEPSKAVADVQARIDVLRAAPSEAGLETELGTSLEQLLQRGRARLIDLMELRMRHEVGLRYFKQTHGITTPATFPVSVRAHVIWVLIAAILESVANSVFFRNESGLLGGFVVAIGVSALNIGTAFFLGYSFRYKNLAGTRDRVVGWGSLALFVGLTLFFNALFAAFRSAYESIADSSDPQLLRDAFTSAMNEAPRIFILDAHLADFMSFILFGVGILLSVFAFYKGYTLDDPYPDYGAKSRAHLEALENEREATERMRDEVNHEFVRQRELIQRLSQEPRELAGVIARKRGDVGLLIKDVEHRIRAICKDCEQVLLAYRTTNRAIRQAPAPAFWDSLPELPFTSDASAAQALLSELAALEPTVSALIQTNSERAQRMLARLADYGRDFLASRFEEYLKECRAAAQDRLDRSTPGQHLAFTES